jgi:hypothetical protein
VEARRREVDVEPILVPDGIDSERKHTERGEPEEGARGALGGAPAGRLGGVPGRLAALAGAHRWRPVRAKSSAIEASSAVTTSRVSLTVAEVMAAVTSSERSLCSSPLATTIEAIDRA